MLKLDFRAQYQYEMFCFVCCCLLLLLFFLLGFFLFVCLFVFGFFKCLIISLGWWVGLGFKAGEASWYFFFK